MKEFWRLIGLMVSLAGFLVVAGVHLYRGDDLLATAATSVITFVALWMAQKLLLAIVGMAADSEPVAEPTESDNREQAENA